MSSYPRIGAEAGFLANGFSLLEFLCGVLSGLVEPEGGGDWDYFSSAARVRSSQVVRRRQSSFHQLLSSEQATGVPFRQLRQLRQLMAGSIEWNIHTSSDPPWRSGCTADVSLQVFIHGRRAKMPGLASSSELG